MNNIYLDVLHMRRPPLNYVSPAICDAVFSSTSFPTLILNALPVKPSITGLRITFIGNEGDFRLNWDNYPGAICYSVYKLNDANDPFGDFTIIAECISDEEFDPNDWLIPFDKDEPACYIVTAITLEGEVTATDPICTPGGPPPGPEPPDGGECISNTSPLPEGFAGTPYSTTLTPDGPAEDPQWTITDGSLPGGLTLDINTGTISGTPTFSGTFPIKVRLTKDGGGFCEEDFVLIINPVFFWEEVLLTPAIGTATFTPAQDAYGNTIAAEVSHPGGDGGASGSANIFATGKIIWRSTEETEANVHVEAVTTGTPPDPTLSWGVSMTVIDPAGPSLLFESSGPNPLDGIFDFPVTLPNTGGADWTIDFVIPLVCSPNLDNGGSITLAIEFTLTP